MYVNQTTLKHGSHPHIASESELISFESTNDIKVKVTSERVIGDECIWEGMSVMDA